MNKTKYLLIWLAGSQGLLEETGHQLCHQVHFQMRMTNLYLTPNCYLNFVLVHHLSSSKGKKKKIIILKKNPKKTFSWMKMTMKLHHTTKMQTCPNWKDLKTKIQVWLKLHIQLTLSQTTHFRHFQIERVCRRQFQVLWKWQIVFQKGRKHCGKRRNCSLWAISPFPTMFSKDW